jgi:hypothetical protein
MILFMLTLVAAARPPVCVEGWCWAWPQATGVTLRALDVISKKELVTVGGGGLVFRWRQGSWTVLGTLEAELRAVWAASAKDVWVCGDGGFLAHYDGSAWAQLETGTEARLSAIHLADGTLTVVGRYGYSQARELYKGKRLQRGVMLEGPVAGPLGLSTFEGELVALTAGPDGLVASGEDGFRRKTADGWKSEKLVRGGANALWTDAQGGLWAATASHVFQETARGWIPHEVTVDFDAARPHITGFGGELDTPLLTVGGAIYGRQGRTWVSRHAMPKKGEGGDLLAVDAAGGTAYAVGEGGLLLRSRGDRWRRLSGELGVGIVGMGSDLVAVNAHGEVWRRSRGSWAIVSEDGAGPRSIHASVAPSGDVWVSMRGHHFDGSQWHATSDQAMNDVYAVAGDVAFGLSRNGKPQRWADGQWAMMDFPGPGRGRDIWAAAEDDLWMTSKDAVWHFDGTQWIAQTVAHRMEDVTGWGPDDVWFLGYNNVTLLHWQDGTFTEHTIPEDLRADRRIRGFAAVPGELWLVGKDGLALQFRGEVWQAHDVPAVGDLAGVHIDPENVYIYGNAGILRRRRR